MSEQIIELRPVAIERSFAQPPAAINNGAILNFYSSGGGSGDQPIPSPSNPNLIIPACICIVLGMLLAAGIGGLRDAQLARQNAILAQQLATQQAQLEGVRSLICR